MGGYSAYEGDSVLDITRKNVCAVDRIDALCYHCIIRIYGSKEYNMKPKEVRCKLCPNTIIQTEPVKKGEALICSSCADRLSYR